MREIKVALGILMHLSPRQMKQKVNKEIRGLNNKVKYFLSYIKSSFKIENKNNLKKNIFFLLLREYLPNLNTY